MSVRPVRVLLSAPTQDDLNQLYASFLGDEGGRVVVAALATSVGMLTQSLKDVTCDVAVVDAELLEAMGEQGILNYLAQLTGTVAIVLIPPALEELRGALEQLAPVRQVLTKPVNYGELVNRVYQVGVSEQARLGAIAPAQAYMQAATSGDGRLSRPVSVAIAGTRVFAFGASKGGTGKTTLATNFAYRLARVGIRTCLLSFDVPDDAGVVLALKPAPNSLHYYRRPSREGFIASIQRKDDLDVLLSPNDYVEAARIEKRKPEEKGSIASLVEAARDHHPPYAAIVMDLPPTETEWAVQPLMRANTVVLVTQPAVTDTFKLAETIRLLTGVFDPRYQVPKSAIYLVINGRTEGDNLTASDMQRLVRDRLAQFGDNSGYTPPVIATIPFNPKVRPAQNVGHLPVMESEMADLARGIDQMVTFFYKDVIGSRSVSQVVKARKKRRWFPIRIKIT